MPTIQPRINIVVERPLYQTISHLAEKDGVSLSLKARDLIKQAIEMQENLALLKLAQSRENSPPKSKFLSHTDIWSPPQKRKKK